MKFLLIQCDKNGIPLTDMGFSAIDAVNYHKWLRPGLPDREFDYIQVNDCDFSKYLTENFIPVGNIEFVEEFLHQYKNIHPKAINIPKELMKEEYLKREVKQIKIANLDKPLVFDENKFIKNALKIKGCSMITDTIDSLLLTGERHSYIDEERYFKEFLVSDIIDICAEWRGFVYRGELLDIRQYLGDIGVWPNINIVKSMISDFASSPPAYVIDVAITDKKETVLVECHNFWSTGLYGFDVGEKLLYMISSAFHWELKR